MLVLDCYNKETPKHNSLPKRLISHVTIHFSVILAPVPLLLASWQCWIAVTSMFQFVGRGKERQEVQSKGFSIKLFRWKFCHFLSYHFGDELISWLHLVTRQPGEWGI